MMADYSTAQYASLWLNLQPLCLSRTAREESPQSLLFLLNSFPPSLFPALRRPWKQVYFYISPEVFKYTAVIVGLPIIPFSPVHLSPVTLQVEDLHFVVKADRSADAENVRNYQD